MNLTLAVGLLFVVHEISEWIWRLMQIKKDRRIHQYEVQLETANQHIGNASQQMAGLTKNYVDLQEYAEKWKKAAKDYEKQLREPKAPEIVQ